ncbi:MAG: GNAT family N-acetyltransferase, partial [Cyanobacteriota bacterium]
MIKIKVLSKELLTQYITEIKEIVEFYPIESKNIWSKDQYLYDISGKWIYSNIAFSDKLQVLGFILASEKVTFNVHIHKWYTKNNLRGQGIGTELYNFLCDKAQQNNIQTISIKVYKENSQALNYYKRLGFIEIGEKIDSVTNLIIVEL